MSQKLKLLVTNIRDRDYKILQEMLSDAEAFDLTKVSTDDLNSEILRGNHYHVLLTDLKEGGEEALALIKRSVNNGFTKPIITITHKGENDFELTLKVGASGYLMMDDLTPGILEYTIKQAVEKHTLIEDLHAKAQDYRMLFHASIDAIYMVDKEKKFVDVNPAMLDLLGYEREELLQMHLKDIFNSQKRKLAFRSIMNKNEFVKDFETVLKKKNGEKLPCIINSVSLKDINNNSITGYQGIIHDLTKRKEAERDILKNEKLAITGRMSRSIAHEVRNPLTNIGLAVEQLKEEFPNRDLDFYTDIISRSCDRINNLVTQLMQATKLSDLDLREYDVNKLLDESIQLVSDRLQLQHVKLVKNYRAGNTSVMVDPVKVRIAISNLLVNAVDVIEQKGGVVVISSDVEEGQCIITIEDNGPGIEPQELGKLFDPFYTGKNDGMGLGLTTTQNIIESHKARIMVESEVGEGSKFIITFDLKNKEAESAG